MYVSTSLPRSAPNVSLLKNARASTVPTAIALPGSNAKASSRFAVGVGVFVSPVFLSPQPTKRSEITTTRSVSTRAFMRRGLYHGLRELIRAENLEELRLPADVFQRPDDVAVGRVALDLDEEVVLPVLVLDRTRLNLREVHAAL